jgi:antitoxin ParD1/3/4
VAIVEITLRDADRHFIEEAIKSGSYVTQSEVVASALDLLKTHEEWRRARRAAIKTEIAKGIDQLARGETAAFDTESFLAKLHALPR